MSSQTKLYDRHKKSGSSEDNAKYKLARRKNKKSFCKTELEYYDRALFEPLGRGDSKLFYSFYKRKTVNSSQSSVALKNKSVSQTSEIFNTFKVFSRGTIQLLWPMHIFPLTTALYKSQVLESLKC